MNEATVFCWTRPSRWPAITRRVTCLVYLRPSCYGLSVTTTTTTTTTATATTATTTTTAERCRRHFMDVTQSQRVGPGVGRVEADYQCAGQVFGVSDYIIVANFERHFFVAWVSNNWLRPFRFGTGFLIIPTSTELLPSFDRVEPDFQCFYRVFTVFDYIRE